MRASEATSRAATAAGWISARVPIVSAERVHSMTR